LYSVFHLQGVVGRDWGVESANFRCSTI
jgi:hypothetical protein